MARQPLRELKQTLSIVSLFECPTVALLAARIGATSAETGTGRASTAAAAALRGKRRRAPQLRAAARLVT